MENGKLEENAVHRECAGEKIIIAEPNMFPGQEILNKLSVHQANSL